MGVIHKLQPNIRNFILETKKQDGSLSCRQLSDLVYDKFTVIISKSSINAVMKNAGLSMPVGRRMKDGGKVISEEKEIDNFGVILLKAADFLVGGSKVVAEIVQTKLNAELAEYSKAEAVLLRPFFDSVDNNLNNRDFGLWKLVGYKYSIEELNSYFFNLQDIKITGVEAATFTANLFKEVRSIKILLSDGSLFNVDGQFYTFWKSSRMPYSFSATYYNIMNYIKILTSENEPLVLFMAPESNAPDKYFLDFMAPMDQKIAGFSLFNGKFEEIGSIKLEQPKQVAAICALWPWQYSAYRKVNFSQEFRKLNLELPGGQYYVAECNVTFTQQSDNKIVTIRGVALKSGMNEKIKMIMLTTAPVSLVTAETIAATYLQRWPNLEETYSQYNRRMQLSPYTEASNYIFTPQNLVMEGSNLITMSNLLDNYLSILDLYIRLHFLPLGYEKKDLLTVKNTFYNLKGMLKRSGNYQYCLFIPPEGYQFLKDLEYACQRLNERNLAFNGCRIWCSIQK